MMQGAAHASPAGISEEQASLRLKGLQHEVERSGVLVRRLRWLAILLVVLLVALLVSLHLYRVMQYARVSKVEASAVDGRPEVAEIRYTPDSAGKIEFVRESEGLRQTLTEYAGAPGPEKSAPKTFTWVGTKGKRPTLRVTYRGGLFLTTEEIPMAKGAREE